MKARALILLGGLLATSSCGSCSDKPGPPAGGSTSATTAASAAPMSSAKPAASAAVTLRFEDAESSVSVRAGQRLLLHEQLPAAGRDPLAWRGLRATAGDKRELALRQFGESYGKTHDAVLYLDAQGRPVLGLFRRARPDMPAHVKAKLARAQVSLVGVEKVEVRTSEVAPQEQQQAALDVVLGGTRKTLTSAQLNALDKHSANAPKQAGRRRLTKRGWRLLDVLKLAKPSPQALAQGATIKGVDGSSVKLTGAQLSDDETSVLLRYNRRGVLIFEMYKTGDKRPSQRVRAVREVLVPPAS